MKDEIVYILETRVITYQDAGDDHPIEQEIFSRAVETTHTDLYLDMTKVESRVYSAVSDWEKKMKSHAVLKELDNGR